MSIQQYACSLGALLLLGCGAVVEDGTFYEEEDDGALGVSQHPLTTMAQRALMITATATTRNSARTEDPCSTTPGDENKVWTIGHMLKREAEKRGVDPQTYVNNWVNAWNTTVTINGQSVQPLMGAEVLTSWQRFSGSSSLPLHKAPFYLLAIVNRLDLRHHRPLGEPLGGEIRFVFGFLTPNTSNPPCLVPAPTNPNSTIILEYSPDVADENAVRDLAERWLALENLSGGGHRSALATLTEEVINEGVLLRIRGNEAPAGGVPVWHLTEFEHNSSGYLQRSTIKQTPTMALAGGSQLLTDWIVANKNDLFQNALDFGSSNSTFAPIGSYSVPNRFPGTTTWFRGAVNPIAPGVFGGVWNPPSGGGADWIQNRFRFSVGTCSGCHSEETGTGSFAYHSNLNQRRGRPVADAEGPSHRRGPCFPRMGSHV